MESFTMSDSLIQSLLPIVARILAAIAVLLVGRWLARRSRPWLRQVLTRTTLTESLIRLIVTLSYFGILILAGLTALAFLGVPSTTLVASAGVVVVILGIALRESLADFAATIIFLLMQPYKIGDVVETCGVTGVVQEIQIFHTVMVTFDKTVVTLSNGKISSSGIINRSQLGILRADVNVGISYHDDLPKAKHILEQMLAEDARVLKDPPSIVIVQDLVSSGVILSARAFTKFGDNFMLKADLTERIKLRFDEAGITIAFPLVDVRPS
jgi:small conductance mechanosensitive channel